MRIRLHPLCDDRGSALVEVALLLPLLLLPLLYGMVFTDLSLVRLEALEAARTLAWEKTVHRPADETLALVQARFRDLDGAAPGDDAPRLASVSLRGFDAGTFHLDDQGRVPLTGGLPALPTPEAWGPPPARTLSGLFRHLGLNPVGLAEAEVRFTVEPPLPGGRTWPGALTVPGLTQPLIFQARHVLVYDTWRGWPAPTSLVGETDRRADPAHTYEIAERVVAAQVGRVAFLGAAGYGPLQKVIEGASALSLPLPLATHGAADHGPTVLRPADPRQVPAFSPAAGRHDATRLGSRFSNDPAVADTPEPGVDRGRYTLPFRVATEQWHRTSGGSDHRPLRPGQRSNDYARTWDCRGPYFLGQARADRRVRDPEAWASCPGGHGEDPRPEAPPLATRLQAWTGRLRQALGR